MDKEELLKQIEELEKENTVESLNSVREIINIYLENNNDKEEHKLLEYRKLMAEINIEKLRIEELPPNSYKEELRLRGRLVKLYNKTINKAYTEDLKMQMREAQLKEIKAQKQVLKEYKRSDTKISIPRRLGLTIQEIAKTLNIFMREKDVITKVTNILKDGAASITGFAAVTAASTLLFQHLLGIPITLLNIVDSFPVLAYVCLSSVIRNIMYKTPFEQYHNQQGDDYKTKVQAFFVENQELVKEITIMMQDVENIKDPKEKIDFLEQIIEKLDVLSKKTRLQGVRESFELQVLDLYRKSKELCITIIDDYRNEKNNDKETYRKYQFKLSKINIEIFKRSNSIKEAIKFGGKSIVNNTAVMVLARAILSVINPQIFSMSEKDILNSFAFSVINGLLDIPTYKNKLKYKETEYQGKIKASNKERIENLLRQKTVVPVKL